jgi:hypothetical protein
MVEHNGKFRLGTKILSGQDAGSMARIGLDIARKTRRLFKGIH